MASPLLIPSLTHSCLEASRTCVCACTVELESETDPLLKNKNKTKRKVFALFFLDRLLPWVYSPALQILNLYYCYLYDCKTISCRTELILQLLRQIWQLASPFVKTVLRKDHSTILQKISYMSGGNSHHLSPESYVIQKHGLKVKVWLGGMN